MERFCRMCPRVASAANRQGDRVGGTTISRRAGRRCHCDNAHSAGGGRLLSIVDSYMVSALCFLVTTFHVQASKDKNIALVAFRWSDLSRRWRCVRRTCRENMGQNASGQKWQECRRNAGVRIE